MAKDASTDPPSDPVTIPARDGYPLGATVHRAEQPSRRAVIINAAIAVPHRFYRHFAAGLAAAGYTTVTWDYRGIGASAPSQLRGFEAGAREWFYLDMPAVVDWAQAELDPGALFLVGHSLGGQAAGLLDNAASVAGMVTLSAQSGHWRLQGGEQKLMVLLHTHVTLPLLSRAFGFMPWGMFGAGEDLPRNAAIEWARWCRHKDYLLGDSTLPLERYREFTAPVLAYSIDDDTWGTSRSVDAMMRAYPNVERRHLEPRAEGLDRIGHVGFFRPQSSALWSQVVAWFDGLRPLRGDRSSDGDAGARRSG
ncbi:MAG: alpha/beta fold hydrolase [Holophagae bacterium]|jgi:predicted alpha/beta hydrolase